MACKAAFAVLEAASTEKKNKMNTEIRAGEENHGAFVHSVAKFCWDCWPPAIVRHLYRGVRSWSPS